MPLQVGVRDNRGMKLLNGLSLFLIAMVCTLSAASAQAGPQSTATLMSCMTNPPTTSYQMLAVEDGFELHVFHHNGTKYMPIHSGTITPNDFELLKKRADYLQQMGSSAKIFFKTSECKNEGPVWKCFSKRSLKLRDLQAEGVSFHMVPRQTSTNNYTFHSMDTFLSFRQKEGHIQYDITSSYSFDKRDCIER